MAGVELLVIHYFCFILKNCFLCQLHLAYLYKNVTVQLLSVAMHLLASPPAVCVCVCKSQSAHILASTCYLLVWGLTCFQSLVFVGRGPNLAAVGFTLVRCEAQPLTCLRSSACLWRKSVQVRRSIFNWSFCLLMSACLIHLFEVFSPVRMSGLMGVLSQIFIVNWRAR